MPNRPAQHGLNPSVHVTTGKSGTIILTFCHYRRRSGVVQQVVELNRRTAKRFAKDVLGRLEASMTPKCALCHQRHPRRAHKDQPCTPTS